MLFICVIVSDIQVCSVHNFLATVTSPVATVTHTIVHDVPSDTQATTVTG